MIPALWEICRGPVGINILITVMDISIALAYFIIGMEMLYIWIKRRNDLIKPLLWVGFTLFIPSCGFTHAYHAWANWWPNAPAEIAFRGVTAFSSLATAIAFYFVLPELMRLASPAAQRAELEREVKRMTHALNHHVGNAIQVAISSLRLTLSGRMSVQMGLERLEEMGREHQRLSEINYHASADNIAKSLLDPVSSPPSPRNGLLRRIWRSGSDRVAGWRSTARE